MAGSPWTEATLYLQITRGVAAQRSHAFRSPYDDVPPPDSQPTELLFVSPYADSKAALRNTGCRCITHPDLRWRRCDIKSLNLLGNVLAAQAAQNAECFEAILTLPEGVVTEGSHCSVLAVVDNSLRTHPLGPPILAGVTRGVALELARAAGLPLREEALRLDELRGAQEIFLTGTTTEVMPVVELDGLSVGSGTPGPVTRTLQRAYEAVLPR